MDETWTWYYKQELIEFKGLIYEKVWNLDGYETGFEYDDFFHRGELTPHQIARSYSVHYIWSPPRHLGEGQVKTHRMKDAIDLGFLRLVAPVKR